MQTHNKELESKGKFMSFILRHGKEEFEGGLIDDHGWMLVDDLASMKGFTKELIEEIVNTNNKSRYEYNEDKTKIRARQGHSIPVDVELKKAIITKDKPYLYHGTSDRFIESIRKNGLLPQSRQYVHLSGDRKTAINVGVRHGGRTVIIKIDALQMVKDGIDIYISNNGVYNTKKVDPKYFTNFIYD